MRNVCLEYTKNQKILMPSKGPVVVETESNKNVQESKIDDLCKRVESLALIIRKLRNGRPSGTGPSRSYFTYVRSQDITRTIVQNASIILL